MMNNSQGASSFFSGLSTLLGRPHPLLHNLSDTTFEISSGYRLGDLLDPDFASNGGQGWFLTFQARLTESVLNPIVDYWDSRMRSTMKRRGGAR